MSASTRQVVVATRAALPRAQLVVGASAVDRGSHVVPCGGAHGGRGLSAGDRSTGARLMELDAGSARSQSAIRIASRSRGCAVFPASIP